MYPSELLLTLQTDLKSYAGPCHCFCLQVTCLMPLPAEDWRFPKITTFREAPPTPPSAPMPPQPEAPAEPGWFSQCCAKLFKEVRRALQHLQGYARRRQTGAGPAAGVAQAGGTARRDLCVNALGYLYMSIVGALMYAEVSGHCKQFVGPDNCCSSTPYECLCQELAMRVSQCDRQYLHTAQSMITHAVQLSTACMFIMLLLAETAIYQAPEHAVGGPAVQGASFGCCTQVCFLAPQSAAQMISFVMVNFIIKQRPDGGAWYGGGTGLVPQFLANPSLSTAGKCDGSNWLHSSILCQRSSADKPSCVATEQSLLLHHHKT